MEIALEPQKIYEEYQELVSYLTKEKVFEGKLAFHTLNIQAGSCFRVYPVHDSLGVSYTSVFTVSRQQQ